MPIPWTASACGAIGHVPRECLPIEQIRVTGHVGFYWKVTTRDNVATFYGLTAAGRIVDPDDATRIFKWLPELTYDDKGNCFEYVYKSEDLVNTPDSVEEQHRRNGLSPIANGYLKRIHYGNKTPYFPNPATPWQPTPPAALGYFFEAVWDYGEHDERYTNASGITTVGLPH